MIDRSDATAIAALVTCPNRMLATAALVIDVSTLNS